MNTYQQVIERERWLTIRDIAKRLDMGESSVRREVKAGRLKAYRFGKIIKVSEADFLEYRESCLINESEIN